MLWAKSLDDLTTAPLLERLHRNLAVIDVALMARRDFHPHFSIRLRLVQSAMDKPDNRARKRAP